jgi:SSS family solute:Na+ symporter
MFPQLFQRFFSAKSDNHIARVMLFYPFVCTIVFFMPIAVGVLGKLSFPDLMGKEADKILPMVLNEISGDAVAALVMAAGLAALMSTMDSQLLTLSSIFTRDIVPLVQKRKIQGSMTGRLFVIFLSIAGVALAYKPPATILQIATQTFTGLAVLFPTVIFGLYLKRVFALPAILSIICGEGFLVAFYLKWISPGGFLPVVWIMLVSFSVYLIVHMVMLIKNDTFRPYAPLWLRNPYVYCFAGLFILAMDFWAWNSVEPAWMGIPFWMIYFVILSAIQTVMMRFWIKARGSKAC